AGGGYQSGAHGRGAHRHARIRADHPAVRPRLADGVKVRGGEIFASLARGAADLLRVPDHDHVHHLLSEGRALAAEAGPSRIRRMLQKCKWNRLHLPAMTRPLSPPPVLDRKDSVQRWWQETAALPAGLSPQQGNR